MTRTGNLEKVKRGLVAAVDAGFKSIRLNSVILRGRNDHEIVDLLEYAMSLGINIAFIEEMPLGDVSDHERLDTMVSNEEVRDIISEKYSLEAIPMTTAGPFDITVSAGMTRESALYRLSVITFAIPVTGSELRWKAGCCFALVMSIPWI